MIQNPYIVGNPVEDRRMFFGRVDDFSYLKSKMAGADRGGILVLCGTRRSGKTSVLFQILKGRLGDSFRPVLIDMQFDAADGDEGLVRAIASRISDAVTAAGTAEPLSFGPAVADFQAMGEALVTYCRRVRQGNPELSIVLMFDEYELFEDAIREQRLSPGVMDLLGDLVRGESGLFIVMAGSTKLEERDADFWAPLLGQSLHRRISFLSRADALRLICEPVADEVSFDPGVPELILGLGAGQPFYTQVICQGLIDHLNEGETTRAQAADVEHVVGEIVNNPLPHMIFTWSSLSDVEKIALAVMAEISSSDGGYVTAEGILAHLKAEKTGITLAGDRLSEALEHLFVDDLLDKNPDNERYAFRMGLWHRWVVRMHSVWQVLEEMKAEGREPDPGVIRLARRRLLRAGLGVLVVLAAAGAWFGNKAMDNGRVIIPPAPDSTYVSFITEPPGARFFLDNYLLGLAPRDSVRVPAGRFGYRVEMDGFRDIADSISLAPDSLFVITRTLARLEGGLRVVTTPPAARVTVDGKVWPEATPTTISGLSVTELHNIRLRLPGFQPASFANQQVKSDSVIALEYHFKRPRHPLTITTNPPGAQIRLDGKDQGLSPVSLAAAVAGEHELGADLAGYYSLQTNVSVPAPGDRLAFDLKRLPPGLLRLSVLPYADIFVDGTRVATAVVARDTLLSVGSHEIRFRHPVLGDYSESVTISSGDTTTVRHSFGGGQ